MKEFKFEVMLEYLFNAMFGAWILHWKNSGADHIAQHTCLDELYNDMKDFCDEYVETVSTLPNVNLNEVLPNRITFEKSATDHDLVDFLKLVRSKWIECPCPPVLSDFQGRLVTKLTHFIFMLRTPQSVIGMFSNDENPLVKELKKHFNNQGEFLVAFNAYLKSQDIKNEEVERLFKDNEGKLKDLSDMILETNTQLFSLKDYYSDKSNDLKREFNEMVRFFDIF